MQGLDSTAIVIRLRQVTPQLINILSLKMFLCHYLWVLLYQVIITHYHL